MLEHGLIQIAGIMDLGEARMLLQCGVTHLGFPLRLPVHREDLSENQAADIIRQLQPLQVAVLITYLDQASEIVAFCRFLGVRVVQLHGDIGPGALEKLKCLDGTLTVIKSLVRLRA